MATSRVSAAAPVVAHTLRKRVTPAGRNGVARPVDAHVMQMEVDDALDKLAIVHSSNSPSSSAALRARLQCDTCKCDRCHCCCCQLQVDHAAACDAIWASVALGMLLCGGRQPRLCQPWSSRQQLLMLL
jgi:hypothetical protein